MMILYGGPTSPFVRKVVISAKLLGVFDRIQIILVERLTSPSGETRTDYQLTQHNPLGKMPALGLEDGTTLYDSAVIAEYLDNLAGGGKIFPRNSARWGALTMAALADGMMDAALVVRYEHTLRDKAAWSQVWIDSQMGKIERGIAALEAKPPGLGSPPDIGQIGVACALGYLDLRYEGKWRASNPRLVAWLEAFSKAVPSFGETTPKG